jgi:hypothetical protein
MKSIFAVISIFIITQLSAQLAIPPSAGSGTEADPYQISTLNQLYWIGVDSLRLNKNYKLINNINAASTRSWFSGNGWPPIGNEDHPFTGVFNGNCFEIDSLSCYVSWGNSIGLFGYISNGAFIKNLGMTNVYNRGPTGAGGLAGYSYNSRIENCYSTGVVSGSTAGGLIGSAKGSNISYSYSICMVSGSVSSGGFIGYNTSTVNDCYSFSLVKSMTGASADNIGGFIGKNDSGSIITRCYSIGKCIGSKYVGGFIGYNIAAEANVSDCFWDIEKSSIGQCVGTGDTTGILGKTTEEMKNTITFTNWDFGTVWSIDNTKNAGYPYLVSNGPFEKVFLAAYDYVTKSIKGIILKCYLVNGSQTGSQSYGVCWNTTGEPDLSDESKNNGYLSSEDVLYYDASTDSLQRFTTYYLKSYVTDSSGTYYGLNSFTSVTTDLSVYRDNDSTFVYPCITTDSTDWNFVGLPLQSNYSTASDFDPAGTNIEAVSAYDIPAQRYKTAVYSPYFGWIKDFPVQTGGSYFINAKNNFDFTVTGDSVNVVYNLIANQYNSDLNNIIVPLTESDLIWSDDIDPCSTYINSFQKWNSATQMFKNSYYTISAWKNRFYVYVGDPLFVNLKHNYTWPSLKSGGIEDTGNDDISTTKAGGGGGPRLAFFHIIKESDSTDFIYPGETDTLKFNAWITSRPSEMATQDSYDCGFIDLGGYSAAYLNVRSAFLSPWSYNEELNIEFILPEGNVTRTVQLNNQSSSIWVGFEPLVPGTGQPIALDYLYGIPGVPETYVSGNIITLNWNAALGATGYNIYSSDDPYGTFSYLANTTTTNWQKSVTPGKRFFYVTSTNDISKKAKKTITVKENK